MRKGRVVFGAMDEVVFGTPAAEAVPAQLDRLGAMRAFLMVSGTLNRETDVVENIRHSLGPRCAGTFDAMPAHTPREAVIAATEQARAANADIIVTVGGGSITDGAKAVQALPRQQHPQHRRHRDDPGAQGRGAADEGACRAPDQRADDDCRRRIQRGGRRHQPADPDEGNAAPRTDDSARRDPRSRRDRAHAGMAVSVDRQSAPSIIASRPCLRWKPIPMPTPRR